MKLDEFGLIPRSLAEPLPARGCIARSPTTLLLALPSVLVEIAEPVPPSFLAVGVRRTDAAKECPLRCPSVRGGVAGNPQGAPRAGASRSPTKVSRCGPAGLAAKRELASAMCYAATPLRT